MMQPILIKLYPLFNAWRAECTACGAYGNSGEAKYISQIGSALENLSKNEHTSTFEDRKKKQLSCSHNYGSYKPRVMCQIDYNSLPNIKECYYTAGCQKFPKILLDNKYVLEVANASGLTYNWSAYSYVRHMKLEEEKCIEKEEEKSAEQEISNASLKLTQIVQQTAAALHKNGPQPTWEEFRQRLYNPTTFLDEQKPHNIFKNPQYIPEPLAVPQNLTANKLTQFKTYILSLNWWLIIACLLSAYFLFWY